MVSNSEPVDVVALESNLNIVWKIKEVVVGSTITGVVDATVKGAKSLTSWDFYPDVKLSPVVDLMEIKTLPYSAVLTTPRLGSNEPLSPPNTDTACVLGNNFFA